MLDGKGGADTLRGYGGGDSYAFTSFLGGGNIDTILDFLPGVANIQLDDGVFFGMTVGTLNPNAFRIGTSALDADDRIIYDPATGNLYFDIDGLGGAGQTQFATLSGAPVVSAGDFTVI